MKSVDELLDIARRAVGLGYDTLLNMAPGEVRHKSDRDTVTEVDLKIETDVRDFLSRVTPEAAFLGEEQGGQVDLNGDQDVWTLDPVDGTSNFAHGVPLCGVSLALIRNGRPIVGAIVAPFLGLRYHAAHERGAFCNDRQIQVSKTTELSEAIVSIGDYAVGPSAATKNARRIQLTTSLAENVERVRMFGSAALDLAWVAEGRTDATIILSNKPWDTAAGVLLAREAGAFVIDAGNTPHSITSTETIAVTPGVADSLLELVPRT
ncbi:myo-inositol-1(or 4)-monophosphatase [Herbihabitans rhizosphaerae]|uniref:Inositol-1-monophosphatase n=1 Tax=Herbihabitans rhizosphaerae TaxID=1872711 RepID=A0A4Q7L2I5_9PSEU|nr:inositol monophosphatase family protein [Herbihabitans rhizosphaerae]RZS43425.1 myo-inositol-1(or 4)-monophosphatase [Herbihabitans rhizosphaerae]